MVSFSCKRYYSTHQTTSEIVTSSTVFTYKALEANGFEIDDYVEKSVSRKSLTFWSLFTFSLQKRYQSLYPLYTRFMKRG